LTALAHGKLAGEATPVNTDRVRIKLGGLKISHRFAFIQIATASLTVGPERLFGLLAQQQINLAFLTTSGLASDGQLSFCVDTDDLTGTLAIVESEACGHRPYDLVADVSLLSLYPTKSRLTFVGCSLLAFTQNRIGVYAASSSISALTFVLDRSQIAGAIEALSSFFELPGRSSWLEESTRIKQIDTIKPE
jgi:aspartokinase